MDTKIDFLYLSEQDTLAAGVNNAAECVDVCEEVFALLAQGDYLMGGSNHNSHGMGLIFPRESPFPNMPTAGPDRRFFAMPAYLGGRFDCCGNKWYGSNSANTAKGLPRSILTVFLNDKDTGAPLCLMSANLLSAARTGAVPAVAARYLVRKDARTAAVLGCGPINKSCFRHIASQVAGLDTVYCYDLFQEKAAEFAAWATAELGIKGVPSMDLQAALGQADVVTVAASRLKPLHIENSWLKKGSTLLFSGPAHGDEAFWTQNRIVFDSIGLHKAYVEEAVASGDRQKYYDGVIGGPIYRLIDDGRLPPLDGSDEIGDIVLGNKAGRTGDDETCIFVACGMAVFDVGWGYELYKRAQREGIGQVLNLWETPYLK